MKDIESEEDIKAFVDAFYGKVMQDPLLSGFFQHVNWEQHMPVMYNFWSSILLGSMKYSGLPFPKHQKFPLLPQHFDQWIQLFIKSIDEHFEGTKAEEAKSRANMISKTFQYKLGILE